MTTDFRLTTTSLTEQALRQRVMRKVARRLIPFLGLAFLLNYLDRTNIAFAKLTMSADLGLSETMYGLASGLFFAGYILLEVPSNLALHRFGARRWIARIMVTWGLIAALMAFVTSPGWLYATRILLGIAEAGFFPGIILYLTWWFPRAERTRLVGLFMVFLPLSVALGAPVSGLVLQHADGWLGLAGWQNLFLVEGVPTVVLGVIGWFYLTDRPDKANWLSDAERAWLQERMAAEHEEVAVAGRHSVRESVRDPRVWVLGGIYFGLGYSLFALSFFLPTIVAGFEQRFATSFSILQTGLIVAVPFAAGAVAMVLWSGHSNRSRERIVHVALPLLLIAVTVPVALYMDSPLTTMIVITLTAIGIFSAFPVFWYLPATFLTGPGAASGIALINTLGAVSGFLAPYVTGWLIDLTGNARLGLWVVGILSLGASAGLWAFRHSLPVDNRSPVHGVDTAASTN